MKKPGLNPAIIAVVGVILCLLAVGGIFTLLIKPVQDETVAQQAIYDANYTDSTPQAQKSAQQQVDAAVAKVNLTKEQWAQKDASLMPRFDVSNRFKAWQQLTTELTTYLAPDVEHQLHHTGVIPLSAISVPAPPTSPNAITAAPIIIPLGSGISVQGDFRSILAHVYEWQDFNRLVLIDGLKLTGNSPYMKGSYTAEVIIFPQGDDKLDKPIAAAGGGSGASGGPTPPMGGPPGMGGPPMGRPPGGPGRPPGTP